MTKRTIFNKHFLHYLYLDRDIKKAVERYSYTDITINNYCCNSVFNT